MMVAGFEWNAERVRKSELPSFPEFILLVDAFERMAEERLDRNEALLEFRMAFAREELVAFYPSASREVLGFKGTDLLASLPALPWGVSYINPTVTEHSKTGEPPRLRWISNLPSDWPHGGPEHIGPDISFESWRIPAFPDWPRESIGVAAYVSEKSLVEWISGGKPTKVSAESRNLRAGGANRALAQKAENDAAEWLVSEYFAPSPGAQTSTQREIFKIASQKFGGNLSWNGFQRKAWPKAVRIGPYSAWSGGGTPVSLRNEDPCR